MNLLPYSPFRAAVLCIAALFTHSASLAQPIAPVLLAEAGAGKHASAAVDAKVKSAAQQDADNAKKWSIYWGWNRSTYSHSDIHFTGSDHDFTIRDVEAKDMQSEVGGAGIVTNYLNPAQFTIPQTNLRIAYQYNTDTAIAFNLDHMKYVMVQNQSVPISGQIKGVTQSGQQVLADDWLNYEHTDGLNILTLELEKQRPVEWFGVNRPAKVFALVGAGIVIPKSNVTMHMTNQVRNDEFHLAGYSVGAGVGLDVDLYKDTFFRTAYKVGYVNLPDVLTSARGDKAAQSFTYNELLIAIGVRF